MKHRSTTPVSKGLAAKSVFVAVAALALVVSPMQLSTEVSADKYDAQIRALERQIDRYQAEADRLAERADTLKNKIAILAQEKAVIQAQIDASEAKRKKLERDIIETEQKIENNRDALGKTLAQMYRDDSISPLEMLASSSNIGDYVDKQVYRTQIRDNLYSTIDEIKILKKKLEDQKVAVERTLKDQKNQRGLLAQREAEEQSLLADTQGKESAYKRLASESQRKKEEVQRQQQAAIEAVLRAAGAGGNAVPGDPNKGGYPANLANSNYYNPVVDPWGMYSRQCVSYTAWKVYQKNGYMPYWGGVGNANQWPGNARAAGIPVSTTPRAGSVGIVMAGQYGHSVWVESVNGDGTINISQYNYYNAGGPGWGHYSEMYSVPASAYDWYIHF